MTSDIMPDYSYAQDYARDHLVNIYEPRLTARFYHSLPNESQSCHSEDYFPLDKLEKSI